MKVVPLICYILAGKLPVTRSRWDFSLQSHPEALFQGIHSENAHPPPHWCLGDEMCNFEHVSHAVRTPPPPHQSQHCPRPCRCDWEAWVVLVVWMGVPARWVVLLPGAAQASMTTCPGFGLSAWAGMQEAFDCIRGGT